MICVSEGIQATRRVFVVHKELVRSAARVGRCTAVAIRLACWSNSHGSMPRVGNSTAMPAGQCAPSMLKTAFATSSAESAATASTGERPGRPVRGSARAQYSVPISASAAPCRTIWISRRFTGSSGQSGGFWSRCTAPEPTASDKGAITAGTHDCCQEVEDRQLRCVEQINDHALHLVGRFLLQRRQREQVAAEDQPVVENIPCCHLRLCVVGAPCIFHQVPRLRLPLLVLTNPGEFNFFLPLNDVAQAPEGRLVRKY